MEIININEVTTATSAPINNPVPMSENTAILVMHGIGNQLPLETLDALGRGFINHYQTHQKNIKITHEIVKRNSENGPWFDNFLRIHFGDDQPFLDIYEYYWANYTEDKSTWTELNTWLQGVVDGAGKFYKENEALGEVYGDKSIFFKNVKFQPVKYRLFLGFFARSAVILDALFRLLIFIVSLIPLVGQFANDLFKSYVKSSLHTLTNVLGDIVIYNVVDPKSKFYQIRKQIMDGAVNAVTHLIEKPHNPDLCISELLKAHQGRIKKLNPEERERINEDFAVQLASEKLYYSRVIVSGHSLGSQIAYDAVNRLNLLVNEGLVCNYDEEGKCRINNGTNIDQQLRGFVTFGSPLDKIVFFLRENIPNMQYLRRQFLINYHGFKQKKWDVIINKGDEEQLVASCKLKRLLEDVPWINFYDKKDYVSGSLDYYEKVTNFDCKFKKGAFTHSNYWESEIFYEKIVDIFFSSETTP
jgi:hypothetical protein